MEHIYTRERKEGNSQVNTHGSKRERAEPNDVALPNKSAKPVPQSEEAKRSSDVERQKKSEACIEGMRSAMELMHGKRKEMAQKLFDMLTSD